MFIDDVYTKPCKRYCCCFAVVIIAVFGRYVVNINDY